MSDSPAIDTSSHVCPRAVAIWMLKSINEQGCLRQKWAAAEIRSQFGREFTYINDIGHLAIGKAVLRQLKFLAHGSIKWDRRRMRWNAVSVRPRICDDLECSNPYAPML